MLIDDIKLPSLKQHKDAVQRFAAKHGYTDVRQGLLGDGAGHIVAPEGYRYRLVYVRFDITGAGTNQLGRAILDSRSTIPYSDTIGAGKTSYDGLPVMVGHKPSVLGGAQDWFIVDDTAGIAGQIAMTQTNPVWQQLNAPNLEFCYSDGSLNVPNVTQVVWPVGWFANNGGGSVTITPIGTAGSGGGGGTTYIVPNGLNSTVAFNNLSTRTVTTSYGIFNFDTFVASQGNGSPSQVTTGASWHFTAPITATYTIGVGIGLGTSSPNIAAEVVTTSRTAPLSEQTITAGQTTYIGVVWMASGETLNVQLKSASGSQTMPIGALVEIGWNDATLGATIYKISAQAVATANVNIASAPTTIDNYTLVSGDRVLLTGQSSGSQNGPWVFNGAASALTRPPDYPSTVSTIATFGMTIYIVNGTQNGGTFWRLTTTGVIIIDATATAWLRMALNAGAITAIHPAKIISTDGPGILVQDSSYGGASVRKLTLADLPAGAGTGSVTSVALTVPAEFSVAGSPITIAGTLAISKANQNANLIYAGPSSGIAAAPTFRALSQSDFPVGALLYKAPAAAAPTANITISAPGATLDGYSPSAGDRIFLYAQSAAAQNGIWIWNGAASALTRPTDYATTNTTLVTYGTTISLLNGTINKGQTFFQNTTGTITIDSTATNWINITTSVRTLTGLVPLANGGTASDLSATGPGFLKQSTNGASVTVATLVLNDLPTYAVLLLPICEVATNTNTTISNPGTAVFDGVTLSNGDTVLLYGQATGSQNGLWTFNGSSSALTRPAWYATGEVLVARMQVTPRQGTNNQGKTFFCSNTVGTTVTIDTTTTSWTFIIVSTKALGGLVALANGGTGSDLSATGPGFLRQATNGANVSVGSNGLEMVMATQFS